MEIERKLNIVKLTDEELKILHKIVYKQLNYLETKKDEEEWQKQYKIRLQRIYGELSIFIDTAYRPTYVSNASQPVNNDNLPF